MARFDKSSTKRPKQDAAVAATRPAKRPIAPSIEDTMFFPRLRRHAKWMFVLLAVALGGGFVLFGVGAGGTGVGNLFGSQGGHGGGGGAPSISSAQNRTEDNPQDVAAWRELSTALQTDGETDRAIDAQRRVVALVPKDADELRSLAGLYLSRASEQQRKAQIADALARNAGAGFPGGLTSPSGQPIVEDRIGGTISAQSQVEIQGLISSARDAATDAISAYKRLTVLQPDDPNLQIELAQTAQQTGDTASAITAYKAFLRLAPDDPNANIVKQQLRQLQNPGQPQPSQPQQSGHTPPTAG